MLGLGMHFLLSLTRVTTGTVHELFVIVRKLHIAFARVYTTTFHYVSLLLLGPRVRHRFVALARVAFTLFVGLLLGGCALVHGSILLRSRSWWLRPLLLLL